MFGLKDYIVNVRLTLIQKGYQKSSHYCLFWKDPRTPTCSKKTSRCRLGFSSGILSRLICLVRGCTNRTTCVVSGNNKQQICLVDRGDSLCLFTQLIERLIKQQGQKTFLQTIQYLCEKLTNINTLIFGLRARTTNFNYGHHPQDN